MLPLEILNFRFSKHETYEVKNNCCSFERLFKVKKNGIFLFGIPFLVLQILMFLCYANEESAINS